MSVSTGVPWSRLIAHKKPTKDRAAAFQEFWDERTRKQASDASVDLPPATVSKELFDKYGPDYGRSHPGSTTERRAKLALEHIKKQERQLVQNIYHLALEDPVNQGPECTVKFGALFDHYVDISDLVVGMLLQARKHGYVTFKGEMLYQRRDENVVITLTKSGLDMIHKSEENFVLDKKRAARHRAAMTDHKTS